MDPYEEIKKLLADGLTTSDEVIKKNIMREVIYKQSSLLSVGEKLIPVRPFNVLDAKWSYPSEMTADYPVAEGATAARQGISFADFSMTLVKGEVRFAMTDEAKIRQLENYQLSFTQSRASEAMAAKKDYEILNTLLAGIGDTVTVAAGKEWDTAAGVPDEDIIEAWDSVLANSNTSLVELRNCWLVVPAATMANLMKLTLIGNVQQTIQDYLGRSYGLTIYPTRDTQFADCALFGVNSEQTAIHGVLSPATPNAVLAETKREFGYDDWVIRQFFKTKVVPNSSSDTTCDRLVKIDNITA